MNDEYIQIPEDILPSYWKVKYLGNGLFKYTLEDEPSNVYNIHTKENKWHSGEVDIDPYWMTKEEQEFFRTYLFQLELNEVLK